MGASHQYHLDLSECTVSSGSFLYFGVKGAYKCYMHTNGSLVVYSDKRKKK